MSVVTVERLSELFDLNHRLPFNFKALFLVCSSPLLRGRFIVSNLPQGLLTAGGVLLCDQRPGYSGAKDIRLPPGLASGHLVHGISDHHVARYCEGFPRDRRRKVGLDESGLGGALDVVGSVSRV